MDTKTTAFELGQAENAHEHALRIAYDLYELLGDIIATPAVINRLDYSVIARAYELRDKYASLKKERG